MKDVETINWNTNIPFLNGRRRPEFPPTPPFNTAIVRNALKKNAGYKPAKIPTNNTSPVITAIGTGRRKTISVRCLPDNWLKYGISNDTMSKATSIEQKANTADSVRNCPINCPLNEPNTLRTPTSLARCAELTVARFAKFTPANNRINKLSAPKM